MNVFAAAALCILAQGPESAAIAEARKLAAEGRPQDALSRLERALEEEPRSARLEHEAGRILESLRRPESALLRHDAAARLDPAFLAAHVAIGNLHAEAGRFAEARAAFGSALALEPKSASALHGLAQVLAREGKLAEAVATFQRAAAANPRSAMVRYGLGAALEKLLRLEDSRAQLEAAVTLDPELQPAHFRLSQVLERMGRREEAAKSLARFRALKAQAHSRTADEYVKAGNVRGAVREFERALDADRDHLPALVKVGAIYLALGELDRSVVCAERAAAIDLKAIRFANLAHVLSKVGRREDALRAIDRACALDPQNETLRAARDAIRAHP